MSLALRTLIYEWRRYMAAVVALATAGLLVLALVGLFMGVARSFSAPIEHSPADLMVLGPKAKSLFNGAAGLPRREIPLLYLNPEVMEVAELEGSGGVWQNDPNSGAKRQRRKGAEAEIQRTFVQVMSVDTYAGAVTLPVDFGASVRLALDEPYGVAIDETARKSLGVNLGDKASLNGHTVKVTALLHGYANIGSTMVFMSRQTARLLGMGSNGPNVGPLVVRLKHPARAVLVRDQLNARAQGHYRVWTRSQLAAANQRMILQNNIVGIMLIGGLVLGSFVGTVITWQTLRGAIFANIKEFASLRALGVSMGSLRRIIMELAFWVGVAGLLMTGVLVWGVTLLGRVSGLPMSYPLDWVTIVVVMLLFIAILSGFLSLGILKQSEPADLLR